MAADDEDRDAIEEAVWCGFRGEHMGHHFFTEHGATPQGAKNPTLTTAGETSKLKEKDGSIRRTAYLGVHSTYPTGSRPGGQKGTNERHASSI